MKHLLLFCLLLFSAPSWAQDAAERGTLDYLNEKYGFRDATFEKPLSEFKAMRFLHSRGANKVYARTTDKLFIGEYAVRSIEYEFYNSLLSTVSIVVDGRRNVEGIYLAMTANYGVPQGEGDHFNWDATRVDLVCRMYEAKSQALFVMMSGPMINRRLEDEEAAKERLLDRKVKAATKAASDL